MPKRYRRNSQDSVAILLWGCAAESYVLAVRRYYCGGTLRQMEAWGGYLLVLGWTGLVLAAAGTLWRIFGGRGYRSAAGYLTGTGAFLGVTGFLFRKSIPAVFLFSAAVPLTAAMGILWRLYDRVCAYSVTVLGIAAAALWGCLRDAGHPAAVPRILALVCAAGLAGFGGFLRAGKLPVPPDKSGPLPLCIVLSLAALLTGLFSPAAAYYALRGLLLAVFGLTVFYTVKQL